MATGDSFAQFETLLREFISGAVTDLVLVDDDPSWNLIDTFEPFPIGGRRTSTANAPGYEAEYRVKLQQGGRLGGSTFDGNTLDLLGIDDHLSMGQTTSLATYLDPKETPLASWIKIGVLLKRYIGSLTVNDQQIIAQLASQPIDMVAGDAMEDAVDHVRTGVTNAFWGDGTASLAQVSANAAVTGVASTTAAISLKTGTFARFKKGMQVQFAETTSDSAFFTIETTGQANGTNYTGKIIDIDRDNRTIKVQMDEGATVTQTAVANNHIVLTTTYAPFGSGTFAASSRVSEGVESLLRNTGDFPGTSFDVSDYSDLKSFISGDEDNKVDPTPEAVALILDKIADAGYPPPEALFAERSLWTLYSQLEREAGAQYVVPQGAAFIGSGGVEGPVMQHAGNRFQRFSSVKMRPGSIVGLAPDTWLKFMPTGNKTIHWVYSNGPKAGIGSIFGAVHSSGVLTELSEAPYNFFCQFGCKVPGRNFRRIGFNSQRDV